MIDLEKKTDSTKTDSTKTAESKPQPLLMLKLPVAGGTEVNFDPNYASAFSFEVPDCYIKIYTIWELEYKQDTGMKIGPFENIYINDEVESSTYDFNFGRPIEAFCYWEEEDNDSPSLSMVIHPLE